MLHVIVRVGILLLVLFSQLIWADPTQTPSQVRYNLSDEYIDLKQTYFIDLLRLAMEKSQQQYGDFELQAVAIDMPQRRAIKSVQESELDVVWTMSSIEREQQLKPVYFPLLKGLLGYRIAVIRKEDEDKFIDINDLEELQRIPVGQGLDWPDSDILQKQGFTLVRGADHNLLTMLNKKRFDYYLRGIHEPWSELVGRSNLMVETTFVIIYPAPIYFFVRQDNDLLAERIEYGLRAALADGSFDSLFYDHAITRGVLERVNLLTRREFRIDNPFLSDSSKNLLSERQLWFNE
ncbi:substrate-binding periplasmic protein [Shewanella psychrotolerans]|uniref:substrate-binding periplasmic protein n=1 Tax=Shewanella psychrotolerans TaxID=2864206 RepID=UPI001C6574BF|nr:hypothetical protein [Shewanella psychrotolerans]QYK02593.1 hypothetical protein K0I62_06490 [Shewanella psychrotolerans]